MITKYLSIIGAACFFTFVFISCESHEQKADNPSDSASGESLFSMDTNKHTAIPMPRETAPVLKNETLSDWEKFKMETEKKIVANENKIKEIKSIPNENAQLFRKVSSLEKDNNGLRKQLDDYNLEEKARWEKFKLQMNRDVSDIGNELKDMKSNAKGTAVTK